MQCSEAEHLLSQSASICHTHDPCLNGSRYRNTGTLYCTRYMINGIFLVSWGQVLASWMQGFIPTSALKTGNIKKWTNKSTISQKQCEIRDTRHITVTNTQEVAYGLSLPEWHNGHYFALFHRISTKWQWLKLVTYCQHYGNNISQKNLLYGLYNGWLALPQMCVSLLLMWMLLMRIKQTSHWCQWLFFTLNKWCQIIQLLISNTACRPMMANNYWANKCT